MDGGFVEHPRQVYGQEGVLMNDEESFHKAREAQEQELAAERFVDEYMQYYREQVHTLKEAIANFQWGKKR